MLSAFFCIGRVLMCCDYNDTMNMCGFGIKSKVKVSLPSKKYHDGVLTCNQRNMVFSLA